MRHLFNALKEHWQIYLGLFLGLVIGLLVGIGFADWKSLVKAFDSKVTDWISSLSTLLGVCIAWVAANSWKQQKMPDFKKKLLDDLLSFEKLFFVYLYNLEKLKNNRNLFEIESISSLAVLEIDFESAKFFDYTLSTKLLEKLEEMWKTLNKIFSQEENLSIDDKELSSILRELISIGTKCEEIILDKDGNS
jgi:uncharacterized 23.2 kDa protein in int-C1 intergenic region|nr:MAG TPA: hypothetical protein [Caudoviricetes sp.]